jgi:hypothetical protein
LGVMSGVAVHFYGKPVSGDDTFIYMRYVENAVAGRGYVFNAGERSYGVTSPAWAFFMAPFAAVAGNKVGLWKGVGVVLTAVRTAVLCFLLARISGSSLWAAILTVLVIGEPHTFRWASSGMEGPLALLTLVGIAWWFWAFWRSPSHVSGICLGGVLGLAPFVRPELGLFSVGVPLVLAHGRFNRRLVVSSLFSMLLVVGVFLGGVMLLFGSPIPQTAAAKAIFLRQAPPSYGLTQAGMILLSGGFGALLVVVFLSRAAAPAGTWCLVTLAAVLGSVAYLSYVNQLVSTRYATYLSAPIVLAAALTAAERHQKSGPSKAIAAALLAQGLVSVGVLMYVFPVTRVDESRQIQAFAVEAKSLLPERSRVALSEVGAFGFYSGSYVIDLGGLTDRATLRLARRLGAPQTPDQLERFLVLRRATHYVETFAGQFPIVGRNLVFVPILESRVERNNFSRGTVSSNIWRLYRIEKPSGKPR